MLIESCYLLEMAFSKKFGGMIEINKNLGNMAIVEPAAQGLHEHLIENEDTSAR